MDRSRTPTSVTSSHCTKILGDYYRDKRELNTSITKILNTTIVQDMISKVSRAGVHGRDFKYAILQDLEGRATITVYGNEGKLELTQYVQNIINERESSPGSREEAYIKAASKVRIAAEKILQRIGDVDDDETEYSVDTIATRDLARSDYTSSASSYDDDLSSSGTYEDDEESYGSFVDVDDNVHFTFADKKEGDVTTLDPSRVIEMHEERYDLQYRVNAHLQAQNKQLQAQIPILQGQSLQRERAALEERDAHIASLTQQLRKMDQSRQNLEKELVTGAEKALHTEQAEKEGLLAQVQHYKDLAGSRVVILRERDRVIKALEDRLEALEGEKAAKRSGEGQETIAKNGQLKAAVARLEELLTLSQKKQTSTRDANARLKKALRANEVATAALQARFDKLQNEYEQLQNLEAEITL